MILHEHIPYDVTPRPLPGILPVPDGQWLHVDEAYAGQMAERRRLLLQRRPEVLALRPQARSAAQELLDLVLGILPKGFVRNEDVTCPDGGRISIDHDDPLGTLGQLIQDDLCILQKHQDEHVLTGAVLCFPASWTLAEKIGRPLTGIHTPVAPYDTNIARRVQRLFDGVRVGAPLWRFNRLYYDDPTLFQPRPESAHRAPTDPATAPFLRSERQTLIRLPETGAVVFAIHTYVVRRDPQM